MTPARHSPIIAIDEPHLKDLIDQHIAAYGTTCDLNHIDVRNIRSMDELFAGRDFQGDISQWNTSNVESAQRMFAKSSFEGDISGWDVRKIRNAESMFESTTITTNLSAWRLDALRLANRMFAGCMIQTPLEWELPHASEITRMFQYATIHGPIGLKLHQPRIYAQEMFEQAQMRYIPKLAMPRLVEIEASNMFGGTRLPIHESLLLSPLFVNKKYDPSYTGYIRQASHLYGIPRDVCEKKIREQLKRGNMLRIEHFVWNILNPEMYTEPPWSKELTVFVEQQKSVMQALGKDPVWNAPEIYMLWLEHMQHIQPLDLPEHEAKPQ